MTGFARRPLTLFVCCMLAAVPAAHAAEGADGHLQAASGLQTARPVSAASRAPGASVMDEDAPLQLRSERRFNVLGRKKGPLVAEIGIPYPVVLKKGDAYPLFIVAGQAEGRADDIAVATGDVELRKLDAHLFGEKLTYWPLDDEIDATGNVRLLQDGMEVNAPRVRMKMSEQVGFAEQPDYVFVKEVSSKFYRPTTITATASTSNVTTAGAPMMMNVPNSFGLPTTAPPTRPSVASGTAERAEFEGENQVTLFDTTYSTCKPGDKDWYLRAAEMHLDYDRSVGEAQDATLWFKGVPIFYSPTGTFPLNSKPKSGFMHPFFATSTRDGVDLTTPYYWNIAPNYDATLYPRYMSKRGLQLGAEARYLDFNFSGISQAEYIPYDKLADRERYAYMVQHQQNLGQGFSAVVNYNRVSDDLYWQDTSSRLLQTSQVQLQQQLLLNYTPLPWMQTNMQVLRYQTLQTDPQNPVVVPYFLEPQINLVAVKSDVASTDLTVVGQYSHFSSATRVQGDRVVVYPQVSLPIVHPAYFVIPKVGLSATQYGLTDQVNPAQPSNISRVLPTFTVDSSLIFERDTSLLGKAFIQTLEPRLYYVNIPYKDQSNIPLFDTAQADFNFAQIFSENRFSGYDRINDANDLTAALTTRMLDGTTGTELFKAMIGQRYYFTTSRVSLNYTPAGAAVAPVGNQDQGYSNLLAAFSGLVMPKTYADVAWDYNYRNGYSDRIAAGLRYQPELAKVLSAGYRYTRDPNYDVAQVNQIDITGQWPLTSRLYAVGRYNWSFLGKQTVSDPSPGGQLLEAIAGFEYNAGCWAARLVGQRLAALSGSPNTTIFFQLELTDFGSVGSNPINLLRRSIPGYGKTNELNTSGSLFTTQ
ncbi:MAG: LPS-assembly protein LptD [Azonexus sp.]